jgi:hypothetical protein
MVVDCLTCGITNWDSSALASFGADDLGNSHQNAAICYQIKNVLAGQPNVTAENKYLQATHRLTAVALQSSAL